MEQDPAGSPDPAFDPDAPDLDDPVLQARIDKAVAPYAGRLTQEGMAEARRMLALVLTTHPVAAPLLDKLREKLGSGVVVRRDAGKLAGSSERSPSAKKRRGVR